MLFKKKGETEIEWKGQGSLPSFDGLNRMQGPGFICSVCHRGDSCSHQHQPKGIQNSTRGSGKRNQQNQKGEHLLCCSLSLSGPGIKRRRRRWGGVQGLGGCGGLQWKHVSRQPFIHRSKMNSFLWLYRKQSESQNRGADWCTAAIFIFDMHSMSADTIPVKSLQY